MKTGRGTYLTHVLTGTRADQCHSTRPLLRRHYRMKMRYAQYTSADIWTRARQSAMADAKLADSGRNNRSSGCRHCPPAPATSPIKLESLPNALRCLAVGGQLSHLSCPAIPLHETVKLVCIPKRARRGHRPGNALDEPNWYVQLNYFTKPLD